MTSEPARVSSPVDSAQQSKQDLARVAEIYSANIEQSLGAIETLEQLLQAKRSRMEELRADHEELALKYKLLGQSLASVNRDLAQQFTSAICHLRSDLGLDGANIDAADAVSVEISKAVGVDVSKMASVEATTAPANTASNAKPETASGAKVETESDAKAESDTSAEAQASTSAAPDLSQAPETHDIPSLPEFLSNGDNASEEKDRKDAARSESSVRGWWNHGKKAQS